VIYESNVITEYLDTIFPEPRVYGLAPCLTLVTTLSKRDHIVKFERRRHESTR